MAKSVMVPFVLYAENYYPQAAELARTEWNVSLLTTNDERQTISGLIDAKKAAVLVTYCVQRILPKVTFNEKDEPLPPNLHAMVAEWFAMFLDDLHTMPSFTQSFDGSPETLKRAQSILRGFTAPVQDSLTEHYE